jgi:hypothetical protein
MTATRRPWSEQEIAQLRKMAEKFSTQEIAKKLDRSDEAIRVQARKFGISVKSKAGPVPPLMPTLGKQQVRTVAEPVESVVAPAAIERAIDVYQQLQPRDPSVILQARKILTQHIYGMVDQGEHDEQRLTVGGLAHLKAVERDHAIKSAHAGPKYPEETKQRSRLNGVRTSRKVSA